MKRAEINNDIVLLRAPVRQARISVINKIVREAQRLRSNHGNEKQLEKNKRKADRLLKQVYALKPIKDDEISKFGIVKWDDIDNMLKNQATDDATRAMAKIVSFKPLKQQIQIFREKFPDYKDCISFRKKPVRKKKDTNHEKRSTLNLQKSQPEVEVKEIAIDDTLKSTVGESESLPITCQKTRKQTDKQKNKSTAETPVLVKKKGKAKIHVQNHSEDFAELENDCDTSNSMINKESNCVVKVISEEATVKRFTDILQETSTDSNICGQTNDNPSSSKEVNMEKEVDDFFMNTDNTNVYTIASCSIEPTNNCVDTKPSRIRNTRDKFQSDLKPHDGRKRKWEEDNSTRGRNRSAMADVSRGKRGEGYSKPERGFGRVHKEPVKTTETENLHPSWAARKKQQDMLKQGFQGKKIVFDED